MTLSIALWRATSSRTASSSPEASNSPVACTPALRLNAGCGRRSGSTASNARRTLGPGRGRRRPDRHLLERALAAHAARGGGVGAPPGSRAQQRAGDLDRVRRAIARQPDPRRGVDQPLAEQEAHGKLLVVARRAHRDRERLAVDADLQRLLDRDEVARAVTHDALQRPPEKRLVAGRAGRAGARCACAKAGHGNDIPGPGARGNPTGARRARRRRCPGAPVRVGCLGSA